jgi:hypothetical protein
MTALSLAQLPGTALPGPEISRRRLGATLRTLREDRGVLLVDAAARLDVVPSTLMGVTGPVPCGTPAP